MAAKTAEYLGVVFHRYLEGAEGRGLVITVNEHKVKPWNPFAPSETTTSELPLQRFEMSVGEVSGSVTLRRFVLPARDEFSSLEEFERYSGPLNWNRQQGIYVYRVGRLVQWGGWNGIRGIDEHTKLARAALEFDTDLDSVFNINVAKIRVTLPPQIRQMLDRPINELCAYADDRYRKAFRHAGKEQSEAHTGRLTLAPPQASPVPARSDVGLALRAAAMQASEYGRSPYRSCTGRSGARHRQLPRPRRMTCCLYMPRSRTGRDYAGSANWRMSPQVGTPRRHVPRVGKRPQPVQ